MVGAEAEQERQLPTQIKHNFFDVFLQNHQEKYAPEIIAFEQDVRFGISTEEAHRGKAEEHQDGDRNPEKDKVTFVYSKAVLIVL